MGWKPKSVYADLQKIAETKPDGKGGIVPCKTWDNVVLTCRSTDPGTGKDFSIVKNKVWQELIWGHNQQY